MGTKFIKIRDNCKRNQAVDHISTRSLCRKSNSIATNRIKQKQLAPSLADSNYEYNHSCFEKKGKVMADDNVCCGSLYSYAHCLQLNAPGVKSHHESLQPFKKKVSTKNLEGHGFTSGSYMQGIRTFRRNGATFSLFKNYYTIFIVHAKRLQPTTAHYSKQRRKYLTPNVQLGLMTLTTLNKVQSWNYLTLCFFSAKPRRERQWFSSARYYSCRQKICTLHDCGDFKKYVIVKEDNLHIWDCFICTYTGCRLWEGTFRLQILTQLRGSTRTQSKVSDLTMSKFSNNAWNFAVTAAMQAASVSPETLIPRLSNIKHNLRRIHPFCTTQKGTAGCQCTSKN